MYRVKKIINCFSKRYISSATQVSKSYLSISDMPHPKSLPIIGTKLDLFLSGSGKKLHEYIDYRHKQLGPIFAERLSGNMELVFISEPTLYKSLFMNLEGKYPVHILPDPWVRYEKMYGPQRGLFFMNGEEWLINRRIVNKHILREGTEDWISSSVKGTIQDFIENLKKISQNGYLMKDMESKLYRLSIDVVVNVLLGKNKLSHSRHFEELLTMFATAVRKIFQTTTELYIWPAQWCQRLNLKIWRDFKESVDLSLYLAKKITKEMIKNSDQCNGLIKRLLQENMKEEIIIRIIADFIIAAGDTTAYTTLWNLLLLTKNEDVMRDIRLKDHNYVKLVVKETMRLYPVAPFLTRILTQDAILDKYKIKEGTPIIASIYTSSRDKQNFSKPDLFLPCRWERNNHQKLGIINHVPSASLPFSIGTRSCVGKKIAMIQLTEVVSEIVKNFEFKCSNKEVINSVMSQILVPDKPIELFFEVRDNVE